MGIFTIPTLGSSEHLGLDLRAQFLSHFDESAQSHLNTYVSNELLWQQTPSLSYNRALSRSLRPSSGSMPIWQNRFDSKGHQHEIVQSQRFICKFLFEYTIKTTYTSVCDIRKGRVRLPKRMNFRENSKLQLYAIMKFWQYVDVTFKISNSIWT